MNGKKNIFSAVELAALLLSKRTMCALIWFEAALHPKTHSHTACFVRRSKDLIERFHTN